MDSKLVQIGIVIVSLFAATIFLVVLLTNGSLKGTGQNSTVTEMAEIENAITETDWDYSAWISDSSFFDEQRTETKKEEKKESKSVSVKVSTIDKDIRIVLLDDKGKVIPGKYFKSDIEGVGKYNDDDRDGVIYVPEVSPGEYYVAINPMAGYAIPEKPIKVTVKSKIEYRAVADISYLIKTEQDIDAEKEDTAVNEAAQETTGNSAVKTVEGAVFGIDVSKYNGNIDWKKVKEQGVKFAIIRCGYRGSKTGAIVEDPYFRQNIEGATKEEIPIGVYFFTQAINEREAVEEASAVMSLIKGYKLTYPVFIDSESAGGSGRADKLEVTDRSRVVQAFCETIRSGNHDAGVYASKNWFNNRLDVSKLSADNVTWLAQYADQPDYGGTYQLWQYSSAGRIPGIEGRVDMNLSYLDVDGTNNDKKEEETTSKEIDEDGQDQSRDM